MPSNNQAVRFIGCSSASYKSLQTYDENTLYFLSDTQQIFVGSIEYTKSIHVLDSQPNAGTVGENGRIYAYNGNLYMCQVIGFSYVWTRIANVNDYEGTVTGVTAGAGLKGGTITETGTISHAVPTGAGAHLDGLADVKPSFGESFQIASVSTDEFGHVTAVNLHTVTLPVKPSLSVSGTAETKETLTNDGEFEVIVGVEKGKGSHDLNITKKTFKLPPTSNAITYNVTTGDAPGSIKLVASDGSTFEAVVKDWDTLSKITDVTSIFRYKGKVATPAALPATGTVGDVYYVESTHAEYVYLGSDSAKPWEELGSTIDLSLYALAEDVIPRVKGETGKVPVFTEDGTLASSGHTLGKDVPADAEFTDTVYEHPTFTPHGLDLYRVRIDREGHVSEAVQVVKQDIVDLGIPAENTDTKVTVHPNTTGRVFIAGPTTPNEATEELHINPNVYIDADGSVTAKEFHGKADTAVQATKDGDGNNIADTYISKEEASEKYVTKSEVGQAKLTWQVI